ncbi:MAG: hypothetical protein IIZ02_03060, partial [Desulfovibrio sp.]|nr:hypothetical protein [Desulfovibrio sp.]
TGQIVVNEGDDYPEDAGLAATADGEKPATPAEAEAPAEAKPAAPAEPAESAEPVDPALSVPSPCPRL